MTRFTPYHPTITTDQVKDFLRSLALKGFEIKTGRPMLQNGWSIELNRGQWIGVIPHPQINGSWCLSNMAGQITGAKNTLNELIFSIEDELNHFGIDSNSPPLQQYTETNRPMSCWLKLSNMIGLATIKAIYDPYMDNKALVNLLSLHSIGTKLDKKLQILTCSKGLTVEWINKFNNELNINIECRMVTKNHPRLIFLSDSRCLSPDFSLNYEQNGTINTIEDVDVKLTMFKNDWRKALTIK